MGFIKTLAPLLMLLALSAEAQQPEFAARKLAFGDSERGYLINVPSALPQGGAPVLIMLHGHGGSAADLVGLDKSNAAPYRQWIPIAKRERMVLVVPDGVSGSDGKQGWNDCRRDAATNPDSDDAAFLFAVLDAVEKETKLDRRRVYVVGTSNGGHMALRVAIEQPQRVAAVAAIVAAMPAKSECVAPTLAVPVLFMNGTDDPVLPYEGGPIAGEGRGSALSTEASARIWRRAAGITADPRRFEIDDANTADSSRVELWRSWTNAVPQVEVYRIIGGGHVEPSQVERYRPFYLRNVGPQNGDIEMAEAVWRFFAAQARR
jgi:polyhydroxybutyrate depolymerase